MTEERDRLTDPKLIFYLERRELIDEWAQLVNLEKAAANEFLRGVLPDVLDRVRELDPDIVVDHLVLEGEELIALWRASWVPADASDAHPVAMIAIGWWKSVRFEVTGSGPFVGLRVRSGTAVPEFRRTLGQLVAERAVGKQAFPSGNPVGTSAWVRYRSLPVSGERYWEDLGPHRRALVDAAAHAWQDFAGMVDLAIESRD